MISQMVAYNMTGSSLLVSLSLSNLQFGSTGCQLKASAAFMVLPDLYMMLTSNRVSSLSQ